MYVDTSRKARDRRVGKIFVDEEEGIKDWYPTITTTKTGSNRKIVDAEYGCVLSRRTCI